MSDSLSRVKLAQELKLWVPGSVGKALEAEVQRAVREYDERLTLGQHNHTGDWCLFLERGPFGEPYPVIGLGRELPHPDDVLKLVHKYDAVRNGEAILNKLNRDNEAIFQARDEAASVASGVIAEAQESFLHDQGRTPYTRSLRPTKQTAVRGH